MRYENKNPWIDVGTTIEPDMVVWPEDPKVAIGKAATIAHDGCNLTHISMSAHTGTHLDVPFHYLDGGATIEKIDPARFIGTAKVFSVEKPVVDAKVLEDFDIRPRENIIFKTANSGIEWSRSPFMEDFVSLDESAARYLATRKINLVGIDYLSIGPFRSGEEVHKVLLSAEILILEGLMLQHIDAGIYEMVCLPLKIKGADGAPARVLLRKLV